jgi:hypothetical protein
MKSSKWVLLVLVLVVMTSLVSFKPVQSPVFPLAPVEYPDTDAMVLAEYQVWYGLESHRCAFSGEPLLPNERPYDSRDPAVISRHIQEAKERGIDGFVVDWYGPEAGVANDVQRVFMDLATKRLFEEAEKHDFRVALLYDDQTAKWAEPDDPDEYESRVIKDLQYAELHYFSSPAYLKIRGLPALFIFPDDEVKPHLNWEYIRDNLSYDVTLINRGPNPGELKYPEDPESPKYDDDFDGFYAWVTATNGQWHPEGLEWGQEYLEWFYPTMQFGPYADKVAVGGVWPGFDDSLAPWGQNRFMSRKGTETHDQTLALAEANNVEYIMVGTWNDFEEGTDIEYGVLMVVDMEKPDPELLIRSTPVMVTWNSDLGSAVLQVYMGGELIYPPVSNPNKQHSPGIYLSLTPRNIYELKIWISGSPTPLSKWIKIRRVDPVPGVDPVIVESNTITVTSPSSGESWPVNSSQTITWTYTGTVENVKIQYSFNNGCNWFEITSSMENDGSFTWTVPDMDMDTDMDMFLNKWLIRVSETDGVPSGTSAMFSIVHSASPSLKVTAPNGGEQLMVGSLFTITWETTGSGETVIIEYSTNGGETWVEITGAAGNNGRYDWTVPDEPSDNCLVRISEAGGQTSDTSDGPFSIVQPSAGDITVTSPNGGEEWEVGSAQAITWTSSGDINSVMIEYSYDSGHTWDTIVSSTGNSGTHDWQVPDTVSDKCLVRVTANDGDSDPKLSDVSDSVFSIVPPTSPTIRVITPNGGEELIMGLIYEITWFATNSRAEVKIEYSINGGETWTEIIGSTENDGEYDWMVPAEPSEICRVRISQLESQAVDLSDAVFSIVQPSSEEITVTSPNGGESWVVGSLQEIKWTSSGEINNVTIEYSTDSGTTWKTVNQASENDGSFDWTVPDAVSDACLVRVTAYDNDLDPRPSDMSDQVFSIIPEFAGWLRVTSPNGGEEWEVGSAQAITWTSSGDINNVMIEYSYDSGHTWNTIVSSTGNSGTHDWQVPDTVSDKCLVRVTANDGDSDPKLSDVSDLEFSIVPPPSPTIRVVAPNGGEQLAAGTGFTITWSAANSRETVIIEYSVNGGQTWKEITGAAENNGKYDWTVPDEPSDNCLVRISEAGGQPSDTSDGPFSIVKPSVSDIKVTSPNGGEEWEVGSTQAITWTSSGDINSVMIEYSYDSGHTWDTIVSSTGNSGTHDWQVPDTVSDKCLVRVTANDGDSDPKLSDVSDLEFSIVPPTSPTIRVITPNGGEELIIGLIYEITWFATDSRAEVKIEYSINGGETWTEIIGSTENDGEYDWMVPAEPSEICRVRISQLEGQPADESDAVFAIVQPSPGEITVTSPNGGESWAVDSLQEITWTSSGEINNVILEYSTDSGEQWLLIDTVSASGGRYAWTVPDTPSNTCLIRITGNDSAEDPSDVSDAVFSIAAQ